MKDVHKNHIRWHYGIGNYPRIDPSDRVRVYAQGAPVEEMPFKTTFFNGSLDLGVSGTRIYGVLWLLPVLGFILGGVGFFLHANWWQPVLIAASLISILLTGMDWGYAFRGTLIDLFLLGAVLIIPIATRFGITL